MWITVTTILPVCLLVVICVTIKVVHWTFGTYSLFEAYAKFKKIRSLEKRYDTLFSQRDNLVYHIGWSKSRGETELTRKMMKELDILDEDLDALETELKYLRTNKQLSDLKKHDI
mmetsp:Transcript_3795/g.5893  ORF Transcript_3795/g.5893 Transcript_3795/m.5893 type:complete len:115 (-) Transcript_3795:220-564(-)